MANTHDWLPSKREDILAMAKTWLAVLETKAPGWQIGASEVSALTDLTDDADTALQAAKQERSPVTTQRCKTAFDSLMGKMRFFKGHFLLVPPLTPADLVSLLLNTGDSTRTPVPRPMNQATAQTRPLGPGLIQLVLEIIGDIQTDPHVADYGFSIYYKVIAEGDPVPDDPETFHHQGFTRRKKDIIERPEAERGKRIYFCLKLENAKGQQGPWGPVFWTIIP